MSDDSARPARIVAIGPRWQHVHAGPAEPRRCTRLHRGKRRRHCTGCLPRRVADRLRVGQSGRPPRHAGSDPHEHTGTGREPVRHGLRIAVRRRTRDSVGASRLRPVCLRSVTDALPAKAARYLHRCGSSTPQVTSRPVGAIAPQVVQNVIAALTGTSSAHGPPHRRPSRGTGTNP